MLPRLHLTVPFVALVLLGGIGCAGTARPPPGAVDVRERDLELALLKGKPAADVVAAMGEPAEVRPIDDSNGRAESWIYRRRIPAPARMVATRMEERAYVDPITGKLTIVPEPVMGTEAITIVEDLYLLIQDGVLDSWARTRREERSYH